MRVRLSCGLAAVVIVLAGSSGAVAASLSAGPPAGLTAAGRALWNFEALLRQTFGWHYQGCLKPLSPYVESFTTDSWCSSTAMAEHVGYSFTFANPSGTTFHLVYRTFPAGAFGNYPEPVRVGTAYVACDPAGRTYLFSFGDVFGLSANLACGKPNG